MARFDVYANPDSTERRHTPYFVDVQNDYIDGLSTRVMIPLRRGALVVPRARNLNPAFNVLGTEVVLDTAALGDQRMMPRMLPSGLISVSSPLSARPLSSKPAKKACGGSL